jgi:phosphate transport system substrate-binding protein
VSVLIPVLGTETRVNPVTQLLLEHLSIVDSRAAIGHLEIKGPGNDLILDTSATSATSGYPIVQNTYEVVCSKGYDAVTATAVKAFLTTAVTDGQRELTNAGYGTLPPALSARLLTAISAIP